MSSARRAMFCAATALVALARILSAWAIRAPAFFSALARSRRAAALVGLALLQVRLPAEVVDVDGGPVGVEVPDLVDDRARAAPTSWEITMSPPLCPARKPRSQVIESASRWLVGSSSSSVPPPASPASPNRMRASSMRRRWPPERVPSGWPSTRSGRPRLAQIRAASASARVAAERGEVVLEVPVPAQRPVVGVVGQLGLDGLHLGQHAVQAAGGEHPVAGGDGQVAGARVLGQVARPGRAARPSPANGRPSPASTFSSGGLAGAVAADEADAVAGLDPQRGLGEQDARAGAQFQAGGSDHGGLALG